MVEQRQLEQWFFRISAYAGQLLKNLEWIDWSESTKTAQRNWIGQSEGAELVFATAAAGAIRVFTTRPDTIFGATYMVLAPEHPMVDDLTTPDQQAAVAEYRAQTARQDLVARKINKEKTGIFTGSFATNPATGHAIPVWIADYVLMDYGTGAIMAVPGHDDRDFEFAAKFALPIVRVVAAEGEGANTPLGAAFTDNAAGHLVNSAQFDGRGVRAAQQEITAWLSASGAATAVAPGSCTSRSLSRSR